MDDSTVVERKIFVLFHPRIGTSRFFFIRFTSSIEVWSSDAQSDNDSWWSSAVSSGFSVLGFLANQTFIFLILTVLSPVNTFLSEQVESDLIGRKFGFDLERFLLDILRMIGVVLIVLFMEFFLMGIWWVVSWMFGFEAINDFVFFIIAAFFYGYSFYDYSLERHSIGIRSSLGFAKRNWVEMVLTGGIFTLSFALPIFALPIAAVFVTIISSHVFLKLTGALDAT